MQAPFSPRPGKSPIAAGEGLTQGRGGVALARRAAPGHIGAGSFGVIKAMFRIFAFLTLAAGFVAAVMDGARTLANGVLAYASLADAGSRLLGARFSALQASTEEIHPLLWDPLLASLLMTPASLALLAAGLLFHFMGRKQGDGVGYLTPG
jgi:hypothetical protein